MWRRDFTVPTGSRGSRRAPRRAGHRGGAARGSRVGRAAGGAARRPARIRIRRAACGGLGEPGDLAGGDLADPPRGPALERHPRRVDRDPLEPGVEPIRVAKARELPPGGDEGLLGGITSVGFVTEDRVVSRYTASILARTSCSNASRSPWLARSTVDRVGRGVDRFLRCGVRTSDAGHRRLVHLSRARVTLPRRRVSTTSAGPARRSDGAWSGSLGYPPRVTATSKPTLNRDYERRSFWQASMAPLPDRSGATCRTPPTSSSSVAGTPGSRRPRAGHVGASPSRSSRRTRSAGARRRATAASSTPATSGAPISSSSATAWRPAGRCTRRRSTRTQLVKRLIADRVDRLRLPRGGPRRAGVRAVACRRSSSTRARAWPRSASARRSCRASASARRSAPTPTSARWRSTGSGLLHPGRYFAGLAAAADRAGADLHEGVRARSIRRQARGRVRRSRHRAARSWRGMCSWPRTATPTASRPTLRRRIIPIGSYIIASEPLPEDLAHELSPKGRAFFDTKNFLYYWHVSADRRMVFGGRASFMPTIDRPDRRDPVEGPARGPPAAGRLPDRVRLGRQRRLHVRPDAARRADEGWRHVRDGLLRDRRRPDDQPRHEGRGLAGRWRGPGAGAARASRSCRRRTRAGRGSCRSPGSGSASRTAWPPGRAARA